MQIRMIVNYIGANLAPVHIMLGGDELLVKTYHFDIKNLSGGTRKGCMITRALNGRQKNASFFFSTPEIAWPQLPDNNQLVLMQ